MKEYASTQNFKKKTELYAELSRRFNIALQTAKKYYLMSDIDLPDPDKPKYYETNNSKLNGYRNIVYKMARDNINHIVIKEYVKSKNFNPSKKMGQNFLVNENIITEIIESISFDNVDTIIEIGPGLGALTKHLVNTNKPVICIELDKRLYSELKVKFKDVKNLTLINNDVLREDFDLLTQNTGKTMIVSNLPYSISSLVIVKFLKCKNIY